MARQHKAGQLNASEDPTTNFVFDRPMFDRFYFSSKYLYFLVTWSVQIKSYNVRVTMGKKARKLGKNLPFLLLFVIRLSHTPMLPEGLN
jgi:hypothetical protein